MGIEVDRFDGTRRGLLTALACGASGVTARSLLGGGFGGLFAGLLATPAGADTALDVQILQTASSVEALAVAAYGVVLGQGPDELDAPAHKALAGLTPHSAREAVTAFAMETMRQHAEHKKAFQALASTLDGNAKVQDSPSPKFLASLDTADLSTPEKVVDFAALLEKVATGTYLANLSMLEDTRTKSVMASVMGVEAQHLATLLAIGALLEGGGHELVAVPFPAASMMDLPRAAGSVAFPDALHTLGGADLIAEPASGAVN